MPKIILNKKDVLNLIGKDISDDELRENIPMLGTDLEKVDDNIEVEIFPNRADMLSEEGFARALSSFLNVKTGLRQYKVSNSKYVVKVDGKVKKIRGEVACAVIKDVNMSNEFTKSLMDLQEKLHITHGRNRKKVSIGVYDLSTIKFPLLFTTKKPDFAFKALDTKTEMTLSHILKNHPKGKEYVNLLKRFKEYPILIDDKKQVLAMPPVINSEETKVNKNTKDLFIDVSGIDKRAVEQALNIMVCSIADRKGKIYEVKVNDEVFPDLKGKEIKVDISYINKLLGLDLNEAQIKEFLNKMGIDYSLNVARYPAYRTDILHAMDIVEDVAIGHGYNNFVPKIPNISTIASEDEKVSFYSKVSEILVGLGFIEVSSYSIIGKEILEKMNEKVKAVELENALTKEFDVLRAWMLPSLMDILVKNKHNDFPQKIFEIGSLFSEKDGKIKEFERLGVLISHSKANFSEIKQVLEVLGSNLGLEFDIEDVIHKSFIKGRVGRVSVNKVNVAYIGEIHPSVINNFELEMPVVGIELNVSELFKLIEK